MEKEITIKSKYSKQAFSACIRDFDDYIKTVIPAKDYGLVFDENSLKENQK